MYLAMIWNDEDVNEHNYARELKIRIRQRFSDWVIATDAAGLFVATVKLPTIDPYYLYPLIPGRGVVIGTLFERAYVDSSNSNEEQPRAVVLADEKLTSQLLADGGNSLRDRYWGRYVAFLTDPGTKRSWVLRDPTGALPCLSTKLKNVNVYFGCLDDLLMIATPALQINEHFLISTLALKSHYSGETGYRDINTVLPGQKIQHDASGAKASFYWNIVELASNADNLDPAYAQLQTKRVVTASTQAWASCFESIALYLSGGLDSSIIAACLASLRKRPEILCVNYYQHAETGDERDFARAVASRCALELFEFFDPRIGRLNTKKRATHTIVPTSLATSEGSTESTRALLESRNIAGIFRGLGGDELFHRDGRLPGVVDEAYRSGLTPRLWSFAMSDAAIDRSSVWHALALAYKYGIRKCAYDWRGLMRQQRPSFLADGIVEAAIRDESHWHPLFRGAIDCPPGKLVHSYRLLSFLGGAHIEPYKMGWPPVICPLLSQPHIELSLQTPLSILRWKRRDRSMARAAFSDAIPQQIVTRKYKSLGTSNIAKWLDASMEDTRELLLDGYLVRSSILNRGELESYLVKGKLHSPATAATLANFMATEVWIRDAPARDNTDSETIALNG